jgi:subtilisin family serine protease
MRHVRNALLAGSVLALAACANDSQEMVSPQGIKAPLLSAAGKKIEGDYIVVLREGVDPENLVRVKGVKAKHLYRSVVNGFAVSLNADQLEAIRADPNVEYVEEDQQIDMDATQSGATWGIDRIDQVNRPLSGTYTYNTTASGVYAYIIDTGIYASHSQFGGRASNVYDALGGNGTDCNGHGTHVAGTVGSSTYGVAKGVQLRGLRTLNCSGSGATSGIISAIDWVRVNRVNPAVANLSLGGGYSSTLNTAINNLANSGVFVAVAAGNENQNACNVSPASAASATTVAATTSTDAKASYSNYGSCVDVYAPGSSITSTWLNGGTNTISGTSMASPHVAGVGALYKATFGNAATSTIDSWIKTNAVANLVTGNITGTPNRLLFKSTL